MLINKAFGLEQIMAVIYTQTIPVNDIIIEHNKNKIPMVKLLQNGNEFEAQISYPDLNHIRIQTNLEVSFIAYIY